MGKSCAKARGVIAPETFHGWLCDGGVSFFAGVPDSLLKDYCAYVTDHMPLRRHVISANEGGAVALAMGHHLATGGMAVVYMQNSGLGNSVNPLTSLADAAIYGIPMLLVIGWRGEPGHPDEPQHVHMGRVTRATLDALEIPHEVLPSDAADAEPMVRRLLDEAAATSSPRALVIRDGTFGKYALKQTIAEPYPMTREAAIAALVEAFAPEDVVVSTTGKPSRELYELRERRGEPHRDLLIVGGMGHASQIALGVALEQPDRRVWCIDGDGAAIMHLGGLATIGSIAPHNYKHVVLNNAAHDSVGGQPTVGFAIDLCAIARACGYRSAERSEDPTTLRGEVARLAGADGPAMLEVRVCRGARADLSRPKMTPVELKQAFARHVRGSER